MIYKQFIQNVQYNEYTTCSLYCFVYYVYQIITTLLFLIIIIIIIINQIYLSFKMSKLKLFVLYLTG